MNETLEYGRKVIEVIEHPWLIKTVVTILIILAGMIIAKLVSKLIEKALKEIELNKLTENMSGLKINVAKAISSFAFYFIVFVSIIMALNELGITTTVLLVLAGAILIIIIISFALGVKDFIPNFFAAMFIHRKKLVEKGDKIKVKDLEGEVAHIGLNETKLITKEGDEIIIPNSTLVKSEIKKKK